MQIHYERINIMETVKNLLAATILISMLSACGCDNNNGKVTNSPAPTAHATDKPDNMHNAADSAGNAIKDAGDAAGEAVEGVTDSVENTVK